MKLCYNQKVCLSLTKQRRESQEKFPNPSNWIKEVSKQWEAGMTEVSCGVYCWSFENLFPKDFLLWTELFNFLLCDSMGEKWNYEFRQIENDDKDCTFFKYLKTVLSILFYFIFLPFFFYKI